MATLTYDPTPADQPEFNEAEQEALAIGEQAAQAEQQMLAGKFKDAEALEQAYIELQKKLGTNETQEDEVQVRGQEESPTEEVEETPSHVDLINAASEHWSQTGELTDDMKKAFSELSSEELISAYMEAKGQQQSVDLTDTEINQIKAVAGGDEGYTQLTQWASANLDNSIVEAFDSLVDSGNAKMVQLAVAGLKAEYEKNNGFEGEMLTGRAPQPQVDVFRSQAEVVQAMQDPRYDRDPAYRQDVFQKLERSNINY